MSRHRPHDAVLLLALLLPLATARTALRNPDGSCVMFPAGSPWHQDVSTWPVYSRSSSIVGIIGSDTRFHADFSGGEKVGGRMIDYGIPTNDVDTNPAKGQRFPANGAIIFDESDDESDHGAYPFPLNATVEGAWLGCDPDVCSGDRHVLVRDNHTCLLYEGYSCRAPASMAGKWRCGSGAIFDLSSPKLIQRHVGWPSADAAGLPIWPGLITVADVLDKRSIDHAIRFTSDTLRTAYQYPATHLTDGGNPAGPWMGMRARLRPAFSCGRLATAEARVICAALKKTGMILADGGSSWYLTGEASPEWQSRLGARYDQFLTDIKSIRGSDVQVVVPPTGACLCDHAHAYNCDTTVCLL